MAHKIKDCKFLTQGPPKVPMMVRFFFGEYWVGISGVKDEIFRDL